MPKLKTMLTSKDAARVLGVTPQRVVQLSASGKLASHKIVGSRGRLVLMFDRDEIQKRKQKHPEPGRPKKIPNS